MKSRLSCSESSGKLWIKWTSISTAVRMFPPRWEYFHRGDNVPTAVRMFPPRWKYFNRGGNVSTAVIIFPPRWKCFHRGGNYFHRGDNYFHMRALVGAYVRALTCSHNVYVWPMHVWARMRVRFRVCACVHACVGAWVRGYVRACVRVYTYVWLLYYIIIVERGSSVGECRTRNQERGVRIPFDTV